jgi:hypothetical protein
MSNKFTLVPHIGGRTARNASPDDHECATGSLVARVQSYMASDDCDQSERLARQYMRATPAVRQAVDDAFICLCGYSLETLIAEQDAAAAPAAEPENVPTPVVYCGPALTTAFDPSGDSRRAGILVVGAPPEQRYLVTWKIDIEAGTRLEAAIAARRIQIGGGSTATVFEVADEQGCNPVSIDLDEHSERAAELRTFVEIEVRNATDRADSEIPGLFEFALFDTEGVWQAGAVVDAIHAAALRDNLNALLGDSAAKGTLVSLAKAVAPEAEL